MQKTCITWVTDNCPRGTAPCWLGNKAFHLQCWQRGSQPLEEKMDQIRKQPRKTWEGDGVQFCEARLSLLSSRRTKLSFETEAGYMAMKPRVPMSRKGWGHHTYPFINLPSSTQIRHQLPPLLCQKKRPTTDTREQQSRLKGCMEMTKAALLYLFLNALFFPFFLWVPHVQWAPICSVRKGR